MCRTIIFFTIIISLSLALGTYQDGWYELLTSNEEPITSVILHNTSDSIKINFHIPGFYLEQDEDSTDYYHISLKDESNFTDSVGLPQVIIIVENIAIPECDSYKEVQNV